VARTPLLDKRIAYQFKSADLRDQALTHRSFGSPHNERLEFLGDALVNQFIAEALYRHWPKADEGALTRARAELVRESALAGIARGLELGPRLLLGPGEMKTGGHRRDSILADALEALVAAIYLGMGTVWGPLLGAFALHVLADLTRNLFGELPGINMVIYGTVLVLIVIFVPRGIAGIGQSVRQLWSAKGGRDE